MITTMKQTEKSARRDPLELLESLPPIFTTADALAAGIPNTTFHRLVRDGKVQNIAWGMYMSAIERSIDLELAEIVSRRPWATICLSSALVEHGLSDAIPAKLDLAIPRGQWKPEIGPTIKWHSFDPKFFEFERQFRPIDGSNLLIGIYSAPRTLADLARHPKFDKTELVEGIRRWLRIRENHPSKLIEIAKKMPGSIERIQEILEIIL